MAKEFPTAWHRQAYIDALSREISQLEQRLEQVVDGAPFAEQLKAELTDSAKKAKAELARVKRSKSKDEETESADEPAEG